MAWSDEDRPTVAQRRALGRAARKVAPARATEPGSRPTAGPGRAAGGAERRLPWLTGAARADGRLGLHLLPRGGRVMAQDLAATPDSGLRVQACGDAHLANFGAYASPER